MIIWGHKGYFNELGFIWHECDRCRELRLFKVYQYGKKFTLYFIPTFSYSSKQVMECSSCHASYEIPKEMKDEIRSKLLTKDEALRTLNMISQLAEGAREKALLEGNKYCTSCGEQINFADKFCKYCGSRTR